MGEGWYEFPDLWSGQKPWWNWYLISVVDFGEVRRAQPAKSTLLTSTLVPLALFKICTDTKERERERESGMRKATGSYGTYSPLLKLQPLVPEFPVEGLPLGRTAALVPEFSVKDMPLGRALWFYIYITPTDSLTSKC